MRPGGLVSEPASDRGFNPGEIHILSPMIPVLALALFASVPAASAQTVGPITPKKNHHKNPRYKGTGSGEKGPTDSVPGSTWFVPGQKGKGILSPGKAARLYFAGLEGMSVSFEFDIEIPDETDIQLLDGRTMMPVATLLKTEDGVLALRDHPIHKTGGYFLRLRTLGDSKDRAKVSFTSSADWALKIDKALPINSGQSRVFKIPGTEGRVVKSLDLVCDQPELVSVKLTNPLGDTVKIKSRVRKRDGEVAIRRIPVEMFGDYELQISVDPKATERVKIQLDGELTQEPAPKARLSFQ